VSKAAPAPRGLQVEGLGHRFGKRRIVEDVSLAIPPGEVHCLVGPSGCGKTTTLRLIAGLETLQQGRIAIDGRTVAAQGVMVPPEARKVGLMFQDLALFPHLRVAENVAFGLLGWSRAAKAERVAELLAKVNMTRHARSYPHTLSGGEQQRVALARALAPSPLLMLLDEAFSALDTTLRAEVRSETMAVLKESGTPTLLVTHDAEEAISVGDRIYAMQDGRIVQADRAPVLYSRPSCPFVAGFFGPVNRLGGTARGGSAATALGPIATPGLRDGAVVDIVLRPEGIILLPALEGQGQARVISARDLGPVRVLDLQLPDGSSLQCRQSAGPEMATGQDVALSVDPRHLFVFEGMPG
jgi:iron(III) transport system ATP-binding protein